MWASGLRDSCSPTLYKGVVSVILVQDSGANCRTLSERMHLGLSGGEGRGGVLLYLILDRKAVGSSDREWGSYQQALMRTRTPSHQRSSQESNGHQQCQTRSK